MNSKEYVYKKWRRLSLIGKMCFASVGIAVVEQIINFVHQLHYDDSFIEALFVFLIFPVVGFMVYLASEMLFVLNDGVSVPFHVNFSFLIAIVGSFVADFFYKNIKKILQNRVQKKS